MPLEPDKIATISCGRCGANSDPIGNKYISTWRDIAYMKLTPPNVIELFGFLPESFETQNFDGTTSTTWGAFCSSWCRWRAGKTKGIHALLNRVRL